MGRSRRTFDRIYGVKPGRDAPKLDRLHWFRSYYLRNLPLSLTVAVGLLVLVPAWRWLVAVICLPWVFGFVLLNWEIRREERQLRS